MQSPLQSQQQSQQQGGASAAQDNPDLDQYGRLTEDALRSKYVEHPNYRMHCDSLRLIFAGMRKLQVSVGQELDLGQVHAAVAALRMELTDLPQVVMVGVQGLARDTKLLEANKTLSQLKHILNCSLGWSKNTKMCQDYRKETLFKLDHQHDVPPVVFDSPVCETTTRKLLKHWQQCSHAACPICQPLGRFDPKGGPEGAGDYEYPPIDKRWLAKLATIGKSVQWLNDLKAKSPEDYKRRLTAALQNPQQQQQQQHQSQQQMQNDYQQRQRQQAQREYQQRLQYGGGGGGQTPRQSQSELDKGEHLKYQDTDALCIAHVDIASESNNLLEGFTAANGYKEDPPAAVDVAMQRKLIVDEANWYKERSIRSPAALVRLMEAAVATHGQRVGVPSDRCDAHKEGKGGLEAKLLASACATCQSLRKQQSELVKLVSVVLHDRLKEVRWLVCRVCRMCRVCRVCCVVLCRVYRVA